MRFSFLALFAAALITTVDIAIPYFTNVRDVNISAPDRQNYAVVDEEIWNHAASDLSDLRFFDGETQVPYVLQQQRARVSSEEQAAKILNLGSVAGHTEFDLDVSGVTEYDHVRLQLAAKDFVSVATVEGADTVAGRPRTQLGSSTLYDFTRENLGSNFVLRIPTSSFRYLHVRLVSAVRPEQVKGASIFNLQEKKAAWTSAGQCRPPEQKGKKTVIACDFPEAMPLNRISFDVPATLVNFRRDVAVTRLDGTQFAAGDISRVRVTRGGTTVVSESTTLDVSFPHPKHFMVEVSNGDDRPLELSAVHLLSTEHRLYFDPQGKASLKLYYGDRKLPPPVYDYAKFFREEVMAAPARLGPGSHNPAFTGRPDDRPWSERHKSVLWAAMLVSVAILALLALRGMRSGPTAK